MALKTLVKVGKISNLSDARYCAGMNVDMLGFRVIAGQDHYVSPELFKEIRGWFSGPAIVVEVYGIQKNEDLPAIIQQYLPDFIELSLQDLLKIHSPSSTYILSTTVEELAAQEDVIAPFRNQISKVIIPASMVSSKGVFCGAGFETPAEALFLGKKLLVVPMKKQYEQYYNAAALREIGVPVLKNVKKKRLDKITEWIESGKPLEINYPDTTKQAVAQALKLGGF